MGNGEGAKGGNAKGLGFLPKLQNDCDKDDTVMQVCDNMKEISFFSIWLIYSDVQWFEIEFQ